MRERDREEEGEGEREKKILWKEWYSVRDLYISHQGLRSVHHLKWVTGHRGLLVTPKSMTYRDTAYLKTNFAT